MHAPQLGLVVVGDRRALLMRLEPPVVTVDVRAARRRRGAVIRGGKTTQATEHLVRGVPSHQRDVVAVGVPRAVVRRVELLEAR